EFALVLEQREPRRRRIGMRVAGNVLERIPPQLGDAVEHLRRLAARADPGVHRVRAGVHLHIAADAQHPAVPLHQRRMVLEPVFLEFLPRQMRQALQAEAELDHGAVAPHTPSHGEKTMNLVSKTYWLGTPFNMRRPPSVDYAVESLLLKAPDGR